MTETGWRNLLESLDIRKAKWKGRRTKSLFLLPMGANGFLSIFGTLETLNLCALRVGGKAVLVLNGCIIALSLSFFLLSQVMIWKINRKRKATLRALHSGSNY